MPKCYRILIISILIWYFIGVTFGQGNSPCPEKCQCYPDPIEKEKTMHLVCKWDQINVTNLDAIRNADAVRTLTIKCTHFAQKSTPPPRIFSRLRYLDRLEIDRCPIESLPEELFYGMSYLYSLIMKHTALEQIPPKIFEPLTNLMTLDLTGNALRVEPPALSSLSNLIQLDLSNNSIRYVSNTLTNSLRLKVLSLDYNQIENIDFRRFSNNLTDLTMKGNKINTIHYYPQSVTGLRRLDLSGNQLDFIAGNDAVNVLPQDLRVLDLRKNKINQIQAGALKSMSKLTTLDLRNNSLSEIKEESLEINRTKFRTQVYLSSNPLKCSCSHRWMLHSQTKFSPIISDLNELYCTNMVDENRRMKIVDVDKTQGFLCKYDSHCLEGCSCCSSTLPDCDCVLNCPPGCNCWRSEGSNVDKPGQNVISCENVRMDRLKQVPDKVTELHLVGSMWKDKGLKNLGFKNQLTLLNLSSSSIDYLNQTLLNQFSRLTTLDLSNNNLSSIKMNDIRLLQSLRDIRLHGNQIQNFSSDVLQHLSKFQTITLGGASTGYDCDCKMPSEFQKWIMNKEIKKKILDFDQVSCLLSNKTKILMKLLDPKEEATICEKETTTTLILLSTTSHATKTQTPKTTITEETRSKTTRFEKTRTTTETSTFMSTSPTSRRFAEKTSVISISQIQSSDDKSYDEKPDDDGFTFKSLPTRNPLRMSKSGSITRPPPRTDIDSGFLYSLLIIILLLVVVCLICAIASTVYLKLIRPKSYNVQKVQVRSVDEEIPLRS